MRTRKEIIEAWITALRSGNYKQGQDYLKRGNQYCCLGVLCELVKDEFNLEIVPCEFSKGVGFKTPSETVYDATLPVSVANHIRTTSQGIPIDAEYNPRRGFESLSTMNDDGMDFLSIAEYIEKRILPLD